MLKIWESLWIRPYLINEIVSAGYLKLLQIHRIKHLFDRETLELLIQSLVLSKLFYCSTVYSKLCCPDNNWRTQILSQYTNIA